MESWRSFLTESIASSASDDFELFMIKKLRDVCGHDFVAKLQRMFSDKDLSKVSLEPSITCIKLNASRT